MIEGAHGDNLPLQVLPLPIGYDTLKSAELPSAVLELAYLYAGYAHDISHDTHTAGTFADAIRMHQLLDAALLSHTAGLHVINL